jgi:signal peptidase II
VVEILDGYLRLIYSENAGGLFGLFQGNAALFAVVSIGVVGLIVAFHGRSPASRSTSIALGLLLGGAVGNLIDRIRHGVVVDFVDMGIGDLRFYTYNVADAAITTAIIALIVLAVAPGVGEAIDRIGVPPEPAAGPAPEPAAGPPDGPTSEKPPDAAAREEPADG